MMPYPCSTMHFARHLYSGVRLNHVDSTAPVASVCFRYGDILVVSSVPLAAFTFFFLFLVLADFLSVCHHVHMREITAERHELHIIKNMLGRYDIPGQVTDCLHFLSLTPWKTLLSKPGRSKSILDITNSSLWRHWLPVWLPVCAHTNSARFCTSQKLIQRAVY